MAYKCTNTRCEYGPNFDGKDSIMCDGGVVPEAMREDAYSQEPAYRKDGRLPWKGLCLNCIDDYNKDASISDGIEPLLFA